MPTTMNVSLPEPLRHFVEEQVNEGGYSSTSDYVRDLIRERRKHTAEGRLRSLIAEGLTSGPAQPVTAADWAARRKRSHR
ncbi:MAG: type II toxin-antitoxin system ParD family antitoxin [Nitrosospira sp.]|nr:type II toxin-antitoxin system ParD family antitoxin [Nitrosospira sp.]